MNEVIITNNFFSMETNLPLSNSIKDIRTIKNAKGINHFK